DCIRDFHVTGVQTCALPILPVQTVPATLPLGAAILQPGRAVTVVTNANNAPVIILCWTDIARFLHEEHRRLQSQFTALMNTLEEIGRASCRVRILIMH